jgi:hypothetical protein
MSLAWGKISNLESSLEDFLKQEALNDGLSVGIRVGQKLDTTWTLPSIQIYVDSKLKPRLEIGSNKRATRYLIILDVRATNNLERLNLADWVETVFNDGFTYYEYVYNPLTPDSPTKTDKGYVGFDFVRSEAIDFGDDVNSYDLYRYRITINAWIIER